MHTFLLFFGYPNGAIWGNVWAMPVCAVIAGAFAFVFRDRLGRRLSAWFHRHFGHRDELDRIHSRLDDHADLLNPDTPGGMAAVIAELRDLKVTVEAQAAGVEALASIVKPAPRRGATAMRKTATGKAGSS